MVETVRVDVPLPPEGSVTPVGLSDDRGPDGEEIDESVTVPAKPFKLASVILPVPDEPWEIVRLDGLLLME